MIKRLRKSQKPKSGKGPIKVLVTKGRAKAQTKIAPVKSILVRVLTIVPQHTKADKRFNIWRLKALSVVRKRAQD